MRALNTLISLWVSAIWQTQAAATWLFQYAVSWVAFGMHLPFTTLRTALWVMDGASDLARTYVLHEPTPQQQVRQYQALLTKAGQRHMEQRRRLELAARELEQAKQHAADLERRNAELLRQVTESQVALEEALNHQAAPEGAPSPSGDAHLHTASRGKPHAAAAPAAEAGWSLHVAVALAAAGLRWWLANEEDAVQRKMMFAVLWPGVWMYAAVVLRCLPRSPALRAVRALLTAGCYLVLGYILHEVFAHAISDRGGALDGAAAAVGGALGPMSAGGGAAAAQLLSAARRRLQARVQWLAGRGADAAASGNATLAAASPLEL